MRIIAEKKGGIGFIYGFVAAVGIFMIGVSAKEEEPAIFIAGLIVTLLGAAILAGILMTPKRIISLDDSGMLILHFCNKTISPSEITDVSYYRASSRGFQYEWGKITITTRTDKYKCNYVANVELVSKELTRLMYDQQNANQGGYPYGTYR